MSGFFDMVKRAMGELYEELGTGFGQGAAAGSAIASNRALLTFAPWLTG